MEREQIFDQSIFKDHLRKKFLDLLDSVKGEKSLLIEECVEGPLQLLDINRKVLSDYGVKEDNFRLIDDQPLKDTPNTLFFCTPKTSVMQLIGDMVLQQQQPGDNTY